MEVDIEQENEYEYLNKNFKLLLSSVSFLFNLFITHFFTKIGICALLKYAEKPYLEKILVTTVVLLYGSFLAKNCEY